MMSPRPETSTFNDYAVMQRKPDPPSDSWWLCPPEEFHQRWSQELGRMQRAPVNSSINPLVLGGKLP